MRERWSLMKISQVDIHYIRCIVIDWAWCHWRILKIITTPAFQWRLLTLLCYLKVFESFHRKSCRIHFPALSLSMRVSILNLFRRLSESNLPEYIHSRFIRKQENGGRPFHRQRCTETANFLTKPQHSLFGSRSLICKLTSEVEIVVCDQRPLLKLELCQLTAVPAKQGNCSLNFRCEK